jgi:hypothetical protein
MGWMRGSNERASAYLIGAVALALLISAPMAWALSESPAAASSPAASTAQPPPATPPSAPPATRVVPSDETEAPAPSEAGAAAPAPKKKVVHHHHQAAPPEVEPATARLRVNKEGWFYAEPSKTSKKIERATVGKFADVTGSTRYYLQVHLKSGQTGYILPSDVDLVKPTDKIFVLTQDAAVLEAPNHWAKRLAEVHRTHDVHMIGIALNYAQIRMKSGLIGFIPMSALQ